jgi:two-component system, cell cycle sensor histidine kinase and response regulator CckA
MPEDALRILILEDVPMDAELVEYELGRARIPFSARRVDSRDEFLRELEEFQPDVILSDYTLPRFDGMTALSLARERAPSIPFLIVTGSVNEETAVGCMKAGATDYLLKSNLARIGPAVQAALERARANLQRTQAEAALAASEQRFRSLVQNSSDLVTILAPDCTILYASDSAHRIVGYSPAELVGSSLLSYLGQEDALTLQNLLQNGNGKTNGAGPIEFSLRRGDGSPVWLEAVGTNLLSDATIRGIVLNARDVSERKRADRALRESEERYRDLFDHASDLVCMAAPDGSLLYVNQAWKDGLGYNEEEIGRMQLLDIVHPECRARYNEVLGRVLDGDRSDHVELVFVPKAGVPITVEGNLSCTFKDGHPAVVRGIYRDITERKRVDEHLRRAERMQAAGKLAGGVAHEVNNMMTIILGFSDLLVRSGAVAPERHRDVEEIRRAATRAGKITQQLLAFSRQQILQPADLQLNDVVQELVPMLKLLLPANVELETSLAPLGPLVRADRAQLDQVIINLAFNARDAMPGGGTLRLLTESRGLDEQDGLQLIGIPFVPGEYALVSVIDTGHGMDSQTLQQVFEPFFTTKPVGSGTGLGLATVYGIVKQSGGYVWVESASGTGTTVTVCLPQVRSEAPVERTRSSGSFPAECRAGNVLVIEDEEGVRELALRILEQQGHRVYEARDGDEAVARLEEFGAELDLVVSDVIVPNIGTTELAQKIRDVRADLPILFMSGYSHEDVVARGLIEPELSFLQKPFTAAELTQLVCRQLDGSPAAGGGE